MSEGTERTEPLGERESPEPAPERATADLDSLTRLAETQRFEVAENRPISEAMAGSEAHAAESLDEARDYAERVLDIDYASFEGFDQRTANEVNATIEVLRARYPDVQTLRYLSSMQHRNADLRETHPEFVAAHREFQQVDENTIAEFLGGANEYEGITINASWTGDHARSSAQLEALSANGFHPPHTGSISGVVAHEYGHAIEADLRRRGRFDEHVQPVVDEYFACGEEWLQLNVSGYAAASQEELLASAFAEYKLSPHPREAARAIGRAIDRAYLNEETT